MPLGHLILPIFPTEGIQHPPSVDGAGVPILHQAVDEATVVF
jgi:hypothetical protein